MRTRHFSVIATLLLASTALITNAAADPRGHGGGGGAPHVAAPHMAAPHMAAPAPHMAAPHMAAPHMAAPHFSAPVARSAPHFSAPHVAAPRMAGPRMAPHVASPRVSPHFSAHRAAPAITHRNGAPRFSARGATRPDMARHAPHTNAMGNAANRLHEHGRNAVGNAANRPNERHGRNAVGNAANRSNERNGRNAVGNATNRVNERNGRAETTGNAAATASRHGAGHDRILRNSALTNLASRNPSTRNFANSTFRGRFARSGFSRDFDRRHHRHDHFGFVLGFVGPLFWPYAYDDFVDYTFWPDAYDTFWPYAYDDVFEGLYGAYAPQYGASYAYAGAPASSTTYRRGTSEGGGTAAQVCSDQAQGLTDFPIEQITRQVSPTQQQQGLLDTLKNATAKAVNIMQGACPNDLPSTPTGRLAAMQVRVQAMLQAVQAVRPALDKFYDSLSDEQKERFNALDQNAFGNAPQPDVAQLCSSRKSSTTSLPATQIARSLRLSDGQAADLKALDDASAKSAEILTANCPSAQTLTPPGRVAAMEQRLNGMLQAIETVRPALNKFYGSLSDEQKARFDQLGRNRKAT
jgi:hypothetical protein